VQLAQWARLAPAIVAVTVAAFATSSPELTVGVTSALSGQPQIALGDSLGSNVVNVALILGGALLLSGIQSPRSGLKRDFPVAIAAPLLTGLLLVDGTLSRVDGALLLAAFAVWLGATIRDARRQRTEIAASAAGPKLWRVLAVCVVGLALLIAAGSFIVFGARRIAEAFGISGLVIGATIVAVGTSIPELATTMIAKLRGHDEVGLGTILGSNILNGLFIVGTTATIHPIVVSRPRAAAVLAFGVIAVLCSYPNRSGFIGRARGLLLIAIYCAYLTTLLMGYDA